MSLVNVLVTNADGGFLEEKSAITDTTVLSQEQRTNDPRASKLENDSLSLKNYTAYRRCYSKGVETSTISAS